MSPRHTSPQTYQSSSSDSGRSTPTPRTVAEDREKTPTEEIPILTAQPPYDGSKCYATGYPSGKICFWDKDGECCSWGAHSTSQSYAGGVVHYHHRTANLVFSPDMHFLASADNDGDISVWSIPKSVAVAAPTLLVTLHAPPYYDGFVVAFVVTPTREFLATADAHGIINIWHTRATVENAEPVTALNQPTSKRTHVSPVHAMAWSPNGFFAAGSDDGTVRLWDAEKWKKPLQTYRGSPTKIIRVEFLPGGDLWATNANNFREPCALSAGIMKGVEEMRRRA